MLRCSPQREASSRHCNILQHTATHCNTLQHTAKRCNTLQHNTIEHVSLLQSNRATHSDTTHTATHYNIPQQTATHCNTLQHIATHSSRHDLQHTATYCNTLQHTATHCNILVPTQSTLDFHLPYGQMIMSCHTFPKHKKGAKQTTQNRKPLRSPLSVNVI